MINKNRYEILQPLILSLLVAFGMLLGYRMKDMPVFFDIRITKPLENTKTLNEAVELINRHFYIEKKSQKLVDDAIMKMTENLNDYSAYVPPQYRDSHDLYRQGKYIGLGIETVDFQKDLVISKVFESSPASKAGLLKGSRISAVNGIDMHASNWNVDSLSVFLRVNRNTEITLGLEHAKYDSIAQISIFPAEVGIRNVKDVYRLDKRIGYINISRFGEGTYADFMSALELLLNDKSLDNLIIDLRSNPGGFLSEVCKIISQLLTEETEFLKTIDRHQKAKSYRSHGKSFFEIDNVIVLINNYSASASEILAGVLQDLDRAIIIGNTSFGKGLVQEQFNLSNGGLLRLSVSYYQLPSGRSIYPESNIEEAKTYYSKIYKRELGANGPIRPDYLVDTKEHQSQYSIFQLALNELENDESTHHESIQDFLENYQLSSSDELTEQASSQIKLEMASMLFDQEGVSKRVILNDPYVRKSIELFEKGDEWGILGTSRQSAVGSQQSDKSK